MSDGSDQATAVLAGLFSSRVRLKVLQRLVAAPGARYHSRELAKQTGEHFNAVWQELKHLEALGVLESRKVGNQVQYHANPALSVLPELRLLLARSVGGQQEVAAAAPPPERVPTARARCDALVMGETD